MAVKIEVQALITVMVSDEEYEELKEISGEKATKFLSFGIAQNDYDMDVFMVRIDEDEKH